ncbi:MAG: bifunctional diaminohydroxyphosphoribosylaminopyrimidine deaminase/5-amino-6-(5-phosphoribosylamino)uracil reductase RibD [Bacteroidia bacterium]
MKAALAESKKALPDCLPNPPVGCVIVKDGQILASGFTQAPGQFHAEASALAQVDGSLADCEIYVTLEPCSFQGRTPSCAKSLVSRHPKKVYISIEDPDPRNLGKGISILQEAGIEVETGILNQQVNAFIASYLNLPQNQL